LIVSITRAPIYTAGVPGRHYRHHLRLRWSHSGPCCRNYATTSDTCYD